MINWKLTAIVAVGAIVIRTIQVNFVRRVQMMSDEVSVKRTPRRAHGAHHRRDPRHPHLQSGGSGAPEFRSRLQGVRRPLFQIERLSAIAWSVLEVALAILFVGVLVGAHLAGTPFPIFFAFMVVLYRFQPLIRALSGANIALAATEASVREVEWLLNPAGKPAPRAARSHSRACRDRSRLTRRPSAIVGPPASAIHCLSFALNHGRTTAWISSRSASGKSSSRASLPPPRT